MNRHTYKLCSRRLSNGSALEGHMRSHVASATAANDKPKLQDDRGFSPSQSSSSSASHGEQEAAEKEAELKDWAAEAETDAEGLAAAVGEAKQLACYGLRENPRKSCRLADPESSSAFAATAAGSSVVLQDRESETESSRPPFLRRRSSRRRRPPQLPPSKPEPSFESEPVSSVSDAAHADDVARCLMLLSRDVWSASSTDAAKRKTPHLGVEVAGAEEEGRTAVARSRSGGRRRHRCGACGKVFRSYQALGGHRASHKGVGGCVAQTAPVISEGDGTGFDRRHLVGQQIRDAASDENTLRSKDSAGRKPHRCPVCLSVFASAQAMGGHKRSHLSHSATKPHPPPPRSAATAGSPIETNFSKEFAGSGPIDLNLPAPMEEEAEMSTVLNVE